MPDDSVSLNLHLELQPQVKVQLVIVLLTAHHFHFVVPVGEVFNLVAKDKQPTSFAL